MQIKENNSFLALLRLLLALEWTKEWFKASFEAYIQGGIIFQKLKSQINENFEKMPKNKQSNFIARTKTPNTGFIKKYIINSGISGGELFSVS